MNNWMVWHVFIQCYSLINYIIITFFILFPIYNISRFVTSGYLDKKVIFLCHASLPSKNTWKNVFSVVGDYSQLSSLLYIYIFKNIPNHWILGVLFTAVIKGFLGRVYYKWFLVYIFELILFYPKRKKSCGPVLLIGIFYWTISSYTGIKKMSLAFVTLVDGAGCFLITIWWYLIGTRELIIGIIIVSFVSTLDGDYCYTYRLSCWCINNGSTSVNTSPPL